MRLTAALLSLIIGIAAVLNTQVWCSESDYKDPDYADDDAGTKEKIPKIITESAYFVQEVGDRVELPCIVENAESAVVQWTKNGKTYLFLDSTRQTSDLRFELGTPISTLVINNLEPKDAGWYACELVNNKEENIRHDIRIYSKPTITSFVPDSGRFQSIKKNTPLTLMCEAAGYPKPTISWTHKRKHSHEEEPLEGEKITYDLVTKEISGEFTCIAENNHGKDTKSIQIDVLYAPEIETPKEIVYSAEGYESELECRVHAHPLAKVSWYKDKTKLSENHRISQVTIGHNHFLRITNTQKMNFGEFKCVANNDIGTTNKTILLTGLPSTPTLVSTTVADDNKSPKLSFEVTSISPILQFQLMYKKQQNDKWEMVFPPIVSAKERPSIYVATHTLKNLEAGTYVAKLKAKNAYGWGSYSETKSFSGVIADAIGGSAAVQSTYLESSMSAANSIEMRISAVFILSLLVAHLLS